MGPELKMGPDPTMGPELKMGPVVWFWSEDLFWHWEKITFPLLSSVHILIVQKPLYGCQVCVKIGLSQTCTSLQTSSSRTVAAMEWCIGMIRQCPSVIDWWSGTAKYTYRIRRRHYMVTYRMIWGWDQDLSWFTHALTGQFAKETPKSFCLGQKGFVQMLWSNYNYLTNR